MVRKSHHRRPRGELDRLIVAIAAKQHGVIALFQLLALGLSERAVQARVASGRLHRVHQGVYAVGRADLPTRGRWMAAVLACGDGAVLSHRSAATLHELLNVRGGRIEVTIPRRTPIRRSGLRVHRSTCLLPSDSVTVDRIPCTSVPVTLLALAATVPTNVLESACNQAEIKEVLDAGEIDGLLERRRSHPGASRLRAVLEVDGLGLDRTKSDLERRFRRLAREAGLPAPAVNDSIPIPGEEMEFDFVWHCERLVVEVDGWETHRTRKAFQDDRRRDQLLHLHGWDVLRFTDRDVRRDVAHVTAVVRSLLDVAGG
jgi:very-short-patch-repair endonuclease/predicted transcriptional regulator of viral defense system